MRESRRNVTDRWHFLRVRTNFGGRKRENMTGCCKLLPGRTNLDTRKREERGSSLSITARVDEKSVQETSEKMQIIVGSLRRTTILSETWRFVVNYCAEGKNSVQESQRNMADRRQFSAQKDDFRCKKSVRNTTVRWQWTAQKDNFSVQDNERKVTDRCYFRARTAQKDNSCKRKTREK